MGEANYYLKAQFPQDTNMVKVGKEFEKFLLEGKEAYKWWQDNRYLPREKFWPLFAEKFPQMYDYLDGVEDHYFKGPVRGGDNNNGLAGLLDFIGDYDAPMDAFKIEVYHIPELLHVGREVWHLANWEPFCAYIKRRWGAIRAGWMSDEYFDDYFSHVAMS